MNKKGQAAMEFLMTYGWAIIIVLAAIGALAYFGVLSPQKLLPDRTTFQAPLPNVDNAVIDKQTNMISVSFKNNKGVGILIPDISTTNIGLFDFANMDSTTAVACTGEGTLTGSLSNGSALTSALQIDNGAGFTLNFNCSGGAPKVGNKFKADISFNYTNVETGQTLKASGSVEGKYT